jgi:tricarballylate dehydrogenase
MRALPIDPQWEIAIGIQTHTKRAVPLASSAESAMEESWDRIVVASGKAALRADGSAIPGLYACGEMVGGVFFNGYPGGSGLTSGAVFGRIAGGGAARHGLSH